MKKYVRLSLAAALLASLAGCSAQDSGSVKSTDAPETTAKSSVPASESSAEAETASLIANVRLIEEGYVEILWEAPVENSTLPDNYRITANGEAAVIDQNQCYYYDKLGDPLTSLRLETALSDPESAHLTIELIEDGENDIATADGEAAGTAAIEFSYDPFYKKTILSEAGIPIKGSEHVQDEALERAAATVDFMLSKSPEIAENMIKNRADIAVTARQENAYYLPEYRSQTDEAVDPAKGLGGNKALPTTSIAEDEVLQNDHAEYPYENVLVHEFGHAIKALGVADSEPLIREYEDAFIHAKLGGLWANASYLISNQEEFFACVSNIWFETVNEREDSTASVNTREELKAYDPQTYAFFSKLYPDERLPEDCWDYASKFSNETVVTSAPELSEPEPPVDPDEAGLPKEEYNLDTDYFKILGYVGTNVVQCEDGHQVTTWWDFSNSWQPYNFDALSWRVTKVGDFYRFTLKKTDAVTEDLALMPENGGTEAGTAVIAAPVDEEDDSQLWQLVRTEGYFCQIVNKASGMVLGTEGGRLPSDGMQVVVNPYEEDPSYGNQWRVLRLKENPGDESLNDNTYAIRPVKK